VTEPISLRTRPFPPDVARGYHDAPAAVRPRSRLGLHVVLFAATCLTALIAGALHTGADIINNPVELVAGLPYAVPLMAILMCHEFGHYVLARAHGVEATLPFFIPAPPIFFIGTFGAFIRMRSLPRDRRALFDVGASGPWAGMVIAIPTVMIGLSLSEFMPFDDSFQGWIFGDSMLFSGLQWLIVGDPPEGMALALHPVAIAGWVGFLVTALNLMPLGQLDGGHVVYAWVGPFWHKWIARGMLTTLLVLGFAGSMSWLVWAALVSFIGLRHPPLADPHTALGRPRLWAARLTAVLFLLTFMPDPIRFSEGMRPIPLPHDAIPVAAPDVPRGPHDALIPL
jgi:membrane-associated protease RseP (regulator of RpoE activity)